MRKLVLFLTLSFCGLTFFLAPSSAKAQLGDGYANSGQACSGLVCGCQNRGSALGKTCPQGLTAMQVDCVGQDAAGGLCESFGPNPKITKCVNSSCPSASDCGCSHEVCNGGVCACNNLGSASGKVCVSANLVRTPVACSGSEFMGGQCDSYVGAATINKCVNPSCPTDPDCICDGQPGEPTSPPGNISTPTPTPTTVPQCFSDCQLNVANSGCPNGTVCTNVGGGVGKCVNPSAPPGCAADDSACWCANACGCEAALAQGLSMPCPQHPDGQPGKIEGPIFGGTVPACFKCDNGDCDKLVTPFPTIKIDELIGNQCRNFSYSIGGPGEDPPPAACGCDTQVCCPKCVAPKVVEGCSPSCDFDIGGPGGNGCACWGSNCNEITLDPGVDPGYEIIFPPGENGNPIGGQYPDISCVKFDNAGVKEIELRCRDGSTCKKEIVIGCSCDKPEEPTPAPGSYSYSNTPWYKLKDDQFHKLDAINDPIPNPVSPYDDDDVQEAPDPACDVNNPTDIRCFNLNQAGVVTSFGDPINTNGAPISHREWNKTVYSKNTQYTPESFLDYALARKKTNIIATPADLVNLHGGEINILTSDLTLSNTSQEGQAILDALENAALTPYVLIIRGDLTVDTDFNVPNPVTNSPLPIAIFVEGGENATGDLKIHHSVETMGGVFIADTLDFSYDSDHSPYPLKVKGNIISYAAANPLKRNRIDDASKPSVFVVFDPILYLNIMDLLSVRTYDWTELTQ